jgi:hypothetical protein
MPWLFSPPSLDDLIRGALIGAAVFYLAPPPHRARATVLVDFNLEQAWPEETDREQFYYLEREVRKLKEIAWSDSVLDAVVEANRGITTRELRDGKLLLSQPADGGWHFYAEDKDVLRAESLASTWATMFAGQVRSRAASADGPNALIEVTVTQAGQLPVERSVSISTYLFVGVVAFLAAASIFVLFVTKPK